LRLWVLLSTSQLMMTTGVYLHLLLRKHHCLAPLHRYALIMAMCLLLTGRATLPVSLMLRTGTKRRSVVQYIKCQNLKISQSCFTPSTSMFLSLHVSSLDVRHLLFFNLIRNLCIDCPDSPLEVLSHDVKREIDLPTRQNPMRVRVETYHSNLREKQTYKCHIVYLK